MRLSQLQERNLPMNKKTLSTNVNLTWGIEFEIAVTNDYDYNSIEEAREAFENSYDYKEKANEIFKDYLNEILSNYHLYDDYEFIDEESYIIKDIETEKEFDLRKCKNFNQLQQYVEINVKEFIDDYYDIDSDFDEWAENKEIFDGGNMFDKDYDYVNSIIDELNLPNFSRWQIVEDTSIEPSGVEIVTPILNTEEIIQSVKLIFEMIKNDEYLSTNSSTGLHINVGTFTINDLDLLKFLVFFNDLYVLEIFGRSNNNKYTDELTSKIRKILGQNINNYLPDVNFKSFNDIIIENMNRKYQSVNFTHLEHENYLEIRAPGGENYEEKEQEVLNTIKRISNALIAAMDENLYKEEYLKKLSKLIDTSPQTIENFNDNLIKDFAKKLNFSLYQALSFYLNMIKFNKTDSLIKNEIMLKIINLMKNFPEKTIEDFLINDLKQYVKNEINKDYQEKLNKFLDLVYKMSGEKN